MKTCFLTIVSANYLAYARVLADSLSHHHDGELQVLIVDRATVQVRAAVEKSGLHCVYAEELGLPDFERLAYKYDILELNTALKPSFLKLLFSKGFEQAIYLDPDIQVHAPLLPVMAALEKSEIVLTPHALKPVMDGLRPSEIDYLRGGTFNLGFIALRKGPDSLALLDWWESRCLGQGFNDQAFGTFVDQKWLELAPSFFDSVCILRDAGCNVAYWNLHERQLEQANGSIFVNGVPLCFFHFSGVNAQQPQQLSKYQSRHQLLSGTVLHSMVKNYCDALLAAGHEQAMKLRYTFSTLDNGTPITPTMRRALLVSQFDEQQPFAAASPLQRQLDAAGLKPSSHRMTHAATTAANFDQNSLQVRAINFLVRLLGRLLGIERLIQLTRYGALLNREAHLASVLLKRPLDFKHRLRR